MTLQDNLYHVVGQDDNRFLIALDQESIIYKAHFPEQPVTPGVCIIQIATELLGQLLNHEVEIKEVVNAKFLSVINPAETKAVTYTFSKMSIDESGDSVKVAVVISSDKTVFAKLSLLFSVNG